jgi:HEAT repeat protein/energy-coupling factor transporter ATP-binding protein EcfA2
MPQRRTIQELLTTYREYLLSKVSKVRILGESDEIDLKEVFVNLSMVDQHAPPLEFDSMGMLDLAVRQRISPYTKTDRAGARQNAVPRRGTRELMENRELLQAGTRAIVTGAPGSGKTTLLKYLALRTLEHEDRFTVWLELKAIAKPLFDIAEKAAAREGSLILVHLWLRHLKTQMLLSDMELTLMRQYWEEKFCVNQIAVLLDGFDELQDDRLEYGLNKCIGEYASPLHSNALIISTRPYAQHKLGHERLRELEIEPLSQRQVEAFLRCYYPNEIATRTLLRKMRQQSSFRDLVQTPLLLGVILRLHREGRLTDDRLEIYLTIINDLVHKLDRSKSVNRQFKIRNERLRLEFLQFLAFERLLIDTVSEGEPDLNRLVFNYAVLKEKAKRFLGQERESYSPRDLADDALATPLLREVKIDNFAFAHLSLQEFLAARELAFLCKQNGLQGVKLFCRAYHNPMLVEMEVLPMVLGALSDADPLYAEIEGWPESVTLANLRIRARGLAYSARISQTRLLELVDSWLTILSRRNPDCEPYEDMVTNSFAGMQNHARELVEAKIKALLNIQDPDFFVRTKQLRRWRSKKALEALVSALSNNDVRIRMEALRVLRETDSGEAIDALTISAKSDPSTDVRSAAIRALAALEDRRATEATLAGLNDLDRSVRQTAASVLWRMVSPHGSEQVINALIRALKDPSENVRSSAAESLKTSKSVRAHDALITVVATDLSPSVRAAAVVALHQWKDDPATTAQLQGLKDKHWLVRSGAASVLGSIGSEAVADALIRTLKDENHFVRMNAAQSLANFFSPRVIDELKSALKDENRGVRNCAAQSLDKIMGLEDSDLSIYAKLKKSEPDLVLPLQRVRRNSEKPRFSDLRILYQQPFLSREHFTRFITVKDLWRMNSKELMPKLTLTIQKSDAFARKKAIGFLGYYSNSVKSLHLLERTAQTDKDVEIRTASRDAAQKLARKFELLDHVISDDVSRPLRDNESREGVLVGQVLTIVASAGHIFRPTFTNDWGIDGEIEFKNDAGEASGRRVYLQLKSGDSYLRFRKRDGKEIFTAKPRHIEYWKAHAYPVILIIRQSNGLIRWMNVTEYLKSQDMNRKQIEFQGEPFTVESVQEMQRLLKSDVGEA